MRTPPQHDDDEPFDWHEMQRLLGRYELCLTDIAAASNHKELCEAILKHKDVFGELWEG